MRAAPPGQRAISAPSGEQPHALGASRAHWKWGRANLAGGDHQIDVVTRAVARLRHRAAASCFVRNSSAQAQNNSWPRRRKRSAPSGGEQADRKEEEDHSSSFYNNDDRRAATLLQQGRDQAPKYCSFDAQTEAVICCRFHGAAEGEWTRLLDFSRVLPRQVNSFGGSLPLAN